VLDVAPVPTAEDVGHIVVRVMPQLTRHLVAELHAAPQAHDLTWPQFRVLSYLSDRSYRAAELADALEISRSTLTALGDGLARRGLVERVRDLPGDRRGVLMRLTENGRSLHAVLREHAVGGVARLLDEANDAERAGLTLGLEALERALCPAAARPEAL
jgi:DNA-binding MarR family transcriptional regulator